MKKISRDLPGLSDPKLLRTEAKFRRQILAQLRATEKQQHKVEKEFESLRGRVRKLRIELEIEWPYEESERKWWARYFAKKNKAIMK